MVPRVPIGLFGAVAMLGCAGFLAGQSLEEARAALRQSLRDVHFAQSLVGLVLTSDEVELAGAVYDVDDAEHTRVSVFALPFSRSFALWGENAPRLYLEGALGYATAKQGTADLYDGAAPGFETELDIDWTTVGGLAGVGLEFELAPGLTVAPIFNLGLSYLTNDTDYGGPGAAVTAALLEGIAFNWDAWIGSIGGAARAAWEHELADELELSVVGRYDLRWSQTLTADDPAQDFATRAQLLTLRTDLVGPTGVALFERDLRWRITGGYRRFLENDFFGVDDFVQLGGGLEVDDVPPLGGKVSLRGSVILGHDVEGWGLGLGFSF